MFTDNTNETPKNLGWICPKCGRVNSPYIDRCPCTGDNNPKLPPYKPNNPWIPEPIPTIPWRSPYIPYTESNTWIYDGPPITVIYGDALWMD